MTHFGVLCRPDTGHINPMAALGRELKRRGHSVTFFQIPDAQSEILAAGLDCTLIGQSDFPLGWTEERNAERGQLSEIGAIHYAINNYFIPLASANLREAPSAIQSAGVEVLLVDQLVSEGGTIADFLDIPFISTCCMLLLNVEPSVPPPFLPWRYGESPWHRWRNQIGHYFTRLLSVPLWQLVSSYRRTWNLPLYSSLNDPYSKLLQLCQQPREFEFPRQQLPPEFHFTGPLIDGESRQVISFPFEKLTGQPLIYASLGTLLNRQRDIFGVIAEACKDLDVQLVISLGNADATTDLYSALPGSPLIVKYAPQLELLRRSSLVITHAGLNTTLEALSNAVPLVAIPVGNDQPAVAARIAWTGVGEVVSLNQLNTVKLRTAIQTVLSNDSYHQNTLRLQSAIHRTGGVRQAADIIEKII